MAAVHKSMFSSEDELLALTKRLVQMNSIVNTEGENVIAHSIYTYLASLAYFQENPTHLAIVQTEDDELERCNVLAFVKGEKMKNNRAVVLMGHMDTVGVDDFNQEQDYAFSPDEWMNYLRSGKLDLPKPIKAQASSDDWLFGRGVLDMKSGLAANLYLISYYAKHPEELDGNLLLLAECDEEDSSHGVLSALKTLKQWKKEHDFHYAAVVNSDFVAPLYKGDPHRYVYKGTVGKLLPSFFVTGAETHVGAPFEGLDPNFLIAELTKQISYNLDLCNEALGETTMPPVSLKQTDLKPVYTVQTALSAFAYYNFFTHSWTPEEVLEKLRGQAENAFESAVAQYTERYQAYCQMHGYPVESLPWKTRVFTYEEMDKMLTALHGDAYTSHMAAFKHDLMYDETLDGRMYAARVIEEAWKWMEDKRPAIFVFYTSLYSPRVKMGEETEDEQILADALEQGVKHVQQSYDHPIVIKHFFPYISDMSFVAMSDGMDDIEAYKRNNPAWGTKLYVAYEDVNDLNIPVINIGPYGMDAHKKYERMEITYSMKVVPNLIDHVVHEVLRKGKRG
ncbi:M20/M25/M40 family metallo-hydrolase [Virgibacillus halophilus]|uniref:M20/M25/M40 family metallo-hydrolase n=1 Tax=Tigheibacillus halophilus TaxID=361280 RepID=A0ABU5C9F2_9BACI|nr:M20/M25/M40 family metallo-hydrolase [Virgibacillus halophilus]